MTSRTHESLVMEKLGSLAEGARLFASLDLASGPSVLRDVAREKRPADALPLFDGALVDGADEASPWLLPIDPSSRDGRLQRSVQAALAGASVVWLTAEASCAELAARLARRLDVRLDDGTELILRHFDPRILHEMGLCLEDPNRRRFFTAAAAWTYLDRDGRLLMIRGTELRGTDPHASPMRLTPAEEHALLHATEAGELLTRTLAHWPHDLMRMSGTQRFELARKTCVQAVALDTNAAVQQMQLLMLAAAHGPAYYDGTDWEAHRARIGQSPEALGQLLEALPAGAGR